MSFGRIKKKFKTLNWYPWFYIPKKIIIESFPRTKLNLKVWRFCVNPWQDDGLLNFFQNRSKTRFHKTPFCNLINITFWRLTFWVKWAEDNKAQITSGCVNLFLYNMQENAFLPLQTDLYTTTFMADFQSLGRLAYWVKALPGSRLPVQSQLDTWLGLRNQPRYNVLGNLWVKTVKTQWLTYQVSEGVPSIMAKS